MYGSIESSVMVRDFLVTFPDGSSALTLIVLVPSPNSNLCENLPFFDTSTSSPSTYTEPPASVVPLIDMKFSFVSVGMLSSNFSGGEVLSLPTRNSLETVPRSVPP